MAVVCLFSLLLSCPATADAMFRGSPQHTGIFFGSGQKPGNTALWRFSTGGGVSSSPAVTDGIVYFGSFDRTLYAVDTATGLEKWNVTTDGAVVSSPAVVNGVVYFGSFDRNLYAVEAATGAERWRFPTGSYISSSPAVVNGIVYIGSDDDHIHAVDALTGRERWAYATESDVYSSPAVADGIVYVGSYDKNLYAIDAGTGKQRWLFRTRSYIHSSPAVFGGMVFFGSNDKNLYAVNAATGTEQWRFATGGPVTSSPAVYNGVVYVGSQDTNLYAIDTVTGKERWRFATGNLITSSPAVSDNIVYIGSLDGNLYAVDAGTGKQLWQFKTGDGISSSPAVFGGIIVTGSNDKNLYALGGGTAIVSAAVNTPGPVVTKNPTPLQMQTDAHDGTGQYPLPNETGILIAAACLTGAGYLVLRSRQKKPSLPDHTPKMHCTDLPAPAHVAPEFSSVTPDPLPDPHSRPEQPVIPPADTSIPVTPAYSDPVMTARSGHPAPDPVSVRLAATGVRAAGLSVYRLPVEQLLSRSHDLLIKGDTNGAALAADEADAASDFLGICESRLQNWKRQGYDTGRLEHLKTAAAEEIFAAFHDYDHAVDMTETIRSDLESVKGQYPDIISRDGFPAAIASLAQHLKNPEDFRAAREEMEVLKTGIENFVRQEERRERHLKNEIIRIEQEITDPEILKTADVIKQKLRSGDYSVAEKQFSDLVASQIARANGAVRSMQDEGVRIPPPLSALLENPNDDEYADMIIRTEVRLRKLSALKELFLQATVLKATVSSHRLLSLFGQGKYEEFISRCEEDARSPGTRPLIFISAKSEDFTYAEQVYRFLTDHGCNVFLSQKTLPAKGNCDFRREIDKALAEAKHMVVVASRKEHVEAPWVEAEWGLFINEKRSGRKKGNVLPIVAGSMKIEDLPIGLRAFETRFLNDPATFDQILEYLD